MNLRSVAQDFRSYNAAGSPTTIFLRPIDDYAEDGGPGEVWLLCSSYHESLRTWIKTIANKFAISNHTALILGVHALRSYLKLISKGHGKNYIKVRPPLVHHLCVIVCLNVHAVHKIFQQILILMLILKGPT